MKAQSLRGRRTFERRASSCEEHIQRRVLPQPRRPYVLRRAGSAQKVYHGVRLKLTGGDRSKGSGVCRPALMARPFVLLSLFALAASPSRLLTQDSLRRVVVDSYAFAYVDRGTGPAIVLVHGALTDYRTWTNQLDAFSQSY